MVNPSISLCIPTLDRFDSFLHKNLLKYIQYVKEGIINEIVICDENGNDYNKILETFKHECDKNIICIYKNDEVLGVFRNKLKVMSLAKPTNFIAIIDSDNFADNDYFKKIKEYIIDNDIKIDSNVVLAPEFTEPFDFTEFNNCKFTKYNIQNYKNNKLFLIFLNTGNYVCSPGIYSKIDYEKQNVDKYHAGPNDVIYLHLLCYNQLENYTIHVIPSLKYSHIIHDDSYWIKTNEISAYFYNEIIIPMLYQLDKGHNQYKFNINSNRKSSSFKMNYSNN